jgi:hypothetical protein
MLFSLPGEAPILLPEVPLLLSLPEEPLEGGMLPEVPPLLSLPEEPLVEGMLPEVPLLLSLPEEPLLDGMLPEVPLLLSLPEEPLLEGMLLEVPLLLSIFGLVLLALCSLCFFLVSRDFIFVPESPADMPEALLSVLLPEDCWACSRCARRSSARCSTAAALAGSVVLEIPLWEPWAWA